MNTTRSALFVLMLTLVTVGPAAAQELESFGVVGGMSRTTMGGGFFDLVKDVGGTVNPRYGIALGGFASFNLAPSTSLRAELLFTQKGVRIPSDGGLRERDLDITYFDVSGLIRRAFPLESVVPWVGAGPTVSLKGSASGAVDGVEVDVSDEVKGIDFGFALEAGAGKDNVDVGVRYLMGLTNISESSDPDEESKNRGLFLLVSYAFPR